MTGTAVDETAGPLAGIRICDFCGQLAGAGATRLLAALGAEVIRVEDPVRQGMWDVTRAARPFVDDRRGVNMSGQFNNHNVGKLGVTINLKNEHGRQVLRRLIAESDVVTENFAAGVLARLGFPYETMKAIKGDIIYVSNCGFGQDGPYVNYKTFGPAVQAFCGLTALSGIAGMPPAGWGYSYMDHHGAYFMAMAVMLALIHRNRTGEGQHVDMACTEAGVGMCGPAVLDGTVNGRSARRPGLPDSTHSEGPSMVPHYIYPARGDDQWIAIACRTDEEWRILCAVIGVPADRYVDLDIDSRLAAQDELDAVIARWSATQDGDELAARLRTLGLPASIVARPEDRVDRDPATGEWGLWQTVTQPEIGIPVRVEGLPVHLSETDWSIERPGPCLGQHNEDVFTTILGYSESEVAELRAAGAI